MSLAVTRAATLRTRLNRFSWPKSCSAQQPHQQFHITHHRAVVKPFLLADVGEGITECQVIQWFVQPGARVEEFDKICEVQSDKASVEITSPYAGVIRQLHYEPDDMAITGRPLLDIDTEDDTEQSSSSGTNKDNASLDSDPVKGATTDTSVAQTRPDTTPKASSPASKPILATPAVRHLLKERNIAIEDIAGTGKDGRVLREDVLNHGEKQSAAASELSRSEETSRQQRRPLSPVQNQMFKTMSRSLRIPHFLYTTSADMSSITALRQQMSSPELKVTAFAFVLKAVSIAFQQHKLLNASLDCTDPEQPALVYQTSHDFGVAVDAPSGLLVPVVRNVQDQSIAELAKAVQEISNRARSNKLTPSDFGNASFTLSNIGAIGGGVVSPVISEPQVAIVGIGRSRIVPAFDDKGELYKREELVLSWSADHRVVDGAECARCAEKVRSLLENPASMILAMR